MLDNLNLEELLIFDIETAPMTADYEELPENIRELWDKKTAKTRPEDISPADWFFERSALQAEFGRVVCISMGYFHRTREGLTLRIKSMADPEEALILEEFRNLLDKHYANTAHFRLCGHNIKEFDLPYLCRRMMLHGMSLPAQLDIMGKKPWEIRHLDTMEIWKFGERRNFTSLNLLTALFNIPTPKDDISGADVARVFWQDNDLDRIVIYCAKDVAAVAQLMLRFQRKPILKEEQILLV